MYIAVAAEGNDLKDEVSQRFGSCKYLLVVNMSDLSVNAIQNEHGLLGEDLAQKVVDFGCEALVAGKLNSAEFNVLAEACVTRYFGAGNSAEKALELMEKGLLKLIRNHGGTEGCGGDHHKQ